MPAVIEGSHNGKVSGLTFFQTVETECQGPTSLCLSLLKFLVRRCAEDGLPANAGWLAGWLSYSFLWQSSDWPHQPNGPGFGPGGT